MAEPEESQKVAILFPGSTTPLSNGDRTVADGGRAADDRSRSTDTLETTMVAVLISLRTLAAWSPEFIENASPRSWPHEVRIKVKGKSNQPCESMWRHDNMLER